MEYQNGNNIDLIYYCRRFRGKNAKIGISTSNPALDCREYTLKKYIEFLLYKSKA